MSMRGVSTSYSDFEKIGEGTYGEVYKATEIATGGIVAIKKIKLHHSDEGVPGTALREIALLKDLAGHGNIVELKEVVTDNNQIFLVFEFLDKDLRGYYGALPDDEEISMDLIKSYLHQILLGVDACHRRGIMHRDLKPQNVLVDRLGNLKLADFGLARVFSIPLRRYTHEVVTLWYRAPEILLGQKVYTPAVDIWSVGTIFAELVMKKALWRGDSEIGQLFKIFQTMGTPDEVSWPGVSALPDWGSSFPRWPAKNLAKKFPRLDPAGIDLLEKMLKFNPADRISAKAALRHPFFAGTKAPTTAGAGAFASM